MSRPKVAHLTTVDISLRYLLLNQLRYLREEGYDVTGISAPGDSVGVVEAAGIRHIAVPMTRRYSPASDLVSLARLVRVFRREHFDVVHTHTPKAGLLGQWAALLAGVPVRVHTIHGLYLPAGSTGLRQRFFVNIERLTMAPSHRNLSQNPEDIPVAVAERISRPGLIELIGNGIDIHAFDPALRDRHRRDEVRASLGLDASHRVVGMVARFVAEKGYREMIRAAQTVASRMPEARFLFVGPAEPEKADGLDPRLIEEAGLAGVVRFLGHRSDVADLYSVMDVLALPSHREGFPRAPMEAAASGVPAVVTDIRGCRQTVDDGKTGYLVPPRDADSLAAALLELLGDDGRRAAFGRAARAKAVAEFDERAVFHRIASAYVDVTGGKSSATAWPRPPALGRSVYDAGDTQGRRARAARLTPR